MPEMPKADLSGINAELYREVGRKVDSLGTGYPPTECGQEIIFWSSIFEEDEARCYINMVNDWQTPEQYAEANGTAVEEAQGLLETMALKALIYREKDAAGAWQYRPVPYAHGLAEFSIGRHAFGHMERNPIRPAQIGMGEGKYFAQFTIPEDPLYHVVPYRKEFVVGGEVIPTDDIKAILDSKDRFAITKCTCRGGQEEPCHPLDTCVVCDEMADFHVEAGIAEWTDRARVDEIMAEGDRDGRFIQVFSNQKSDIICSCCGCGCGILKFPQIFPGNSIKNWTNYPSTLEAPEKCNGCGTCIEVCAMHTLELRDGLPVDAKGICVGCSLCVSNCPTGARKLKKKADEDLYIPPATIWEQYDRQAADIAAAKSAAN